MLVNMDVHGTRRPVGTRLPTDSSHVSSTRTKWDAVGGLLHAPLRLHMESLKHWHMHIDTGVNVMNERAQVPPAAVTSQSLNTYTGATVHGAKTQVHWQPPAGTSIVCSTCMSTDVPGDMKPA